MLDEIINQTTAAVTEIITVANLNPGDLLVIGCSSSEIAGGVIGKNSSEEIGSAVANAAIKAAEKFGVKIAAQCCEHLNRALIMELDTAKSRNYEIVNVRPMPKAGGSFATGVYNAMQNPVAVETVKADAGLDIGNTLIGMHLKAVAVPVRLKVEKIGAAYLTAAKTRAKYIGGARAHYV